MEGLISIGQLASDMGISIRTIRYYEEVGIFKPAKTADSNYRYYGSAEIEKLGIIIFLRKVGFSLQDIRTLLFENRYLKLKDNFPVKVIGVGGASISAINKLTVDGAKFDIIHVDERKRGHAA